MSEENKNFKAEKEQLPVVMEKFKNHEQTIKELKEKIQALELNNKEIKTLSDKFEKKITVLL